MRNTKNIDHTPIYTLYMIWLFYDVLHTTLIPMLNE